MYVIQEAIMAQMRWIDPTCNSVVWLLAVGKSLLMIVPSEEKGMMAALESAGVPVKQIRMNPDKQQKIGPALQALCSKDAELKACSVFSTPY
jgi:hypothetical protein